MKKMLFFVSFISLLFPATSKPQGNIVKRGDIVRLDIINGQFTDFNGLTWKQASSNDSANYYTNAFTIDSNSYLIQALDLPYNSEGLWIQTVGQDLLTNVKTGSSKLYFNLANFINFAGFSYYSPYLYRVDNGVWIFYDLNGKAFISMNDSLTTYFDDYFYKHRLIHIPGKIQNDYLIALLKRESMEAEYFLTGLQNAPDYDTTNVQKINFKDDKIIVSGIVNLFDNLYVLSTNYDYNNLFHLALLKNDSIFTEPILSVNQDFEKWTYKNAALYIYFDENLYKYDFTASDTTFKNKRIIASGKMDIDFENLFSTKFYRDSLVIFDMENEYNLKTFSIDSLNIYKKLKPLLDYPYVYMHRLKSITSVEQQSVIPEDFRIATYPNPFNNKITFRLDLADHYFEKPTLFNVTGQKIFEETFDSASRTRRITWKTNTESSGIYFARIQTNHTVQMKKVILIK
jgi:Secretion system C-terminal sorting domain